MAPRVCTARVPSSNQFAVLSQCTIAVHAADASRPISTGKLLHLQETAVTKPHRIKTCDKKEETQTQTQKMYIRCNDEMHRQHVPRPLLDMFMHKEINVLGASNSVMQSRGKLKHYLDYWPNFQDCRGTAI
jgi:hypothetical protein